MANCNIFCAAGFDSLALPIGPEDYIIAADGGLQHTQALALTPHAVLGDFDSLGYIPEGAACFPVEKDDTDAMLALRLGLKQGYRNFLLYGSLDGPRLDHTIANFQALQYLADHGARGFLVGKDYLVTVLQNGSLHFAQGCSGTISIFCMGADAQGVTLKGLYYPLENGTLSAGYPLGVSNHFTGQAAHIHVDRGSLLVLWDRANGFPGCTP